VARASRHTRRDGVIAAWRGLRGLYAALWVLSLWELSAPVAVVFF